jgi:hypothetical protein
MATLLIPEAYDAERAPPLSPLPLWQRLKLRELALCLLTFHLGFFAHLFFRELAPDSPIQFHAAAPAEPAPFSMKTLLGMVESMPDDGFRACLQMVIGTAYADRCDELLVHSLPFLQRVLGNKDKAADATPDAKPRKRIKPKRQKRPNPNSGQLLTSLDSAS